MEHIELSADEPPVSARRNVGWLLRSTARTWPDQLAIAFPTGRDRRGKRTYRRVSFAELDRMSDRIAQGLRDAGLEPGTRVAMMVPQSIEFISIVFALFKAGLVQILIDPGMGKRNMLRCLAEAEPRALIGIPKAHFATWLFGRRFPLLKKRICVGAPRFPGSVSLATWLGDDRLATSTDDPTAYLEPVGDRSEAAIIFTTGSTGPPKGVLYHHATFRGQAMEVQRFYDIAPGEIDLPGFPLFALFN
ncbi:MAG: AMP-binding protein, partial [Planctomycetales bacterium]|nr:AMP-binding protein [Planctomycetales bacterium]